MTIHDLVFLHLSFWLKIAQFICINMTIIWTENELFANNQKHINM